MVDLLQTAIEAIRGQIQTLLTTVSDSQIGLMLASQSPSSANDCTADLLKCLGFKIISIIETGALLGIYTLSMCYVLYKVGWSLDKSAYITILVFFVAELTSLILYIVNAFGDQTTGGMPDLLAQSALYAVLLFYAYQMKVVQLKITCEDHTQFFLRLKRV